MGQVFSSFRRKEAAEVPKDPFNAAALNEGPVALPFVPVQVPAEQVLAQPPVQQQQMQQQVPLPPAKPGIRERVKSLFMKDGEASSSSHAPVVVPGAEPWETWGHRGEWRVRREHLFQRILAVYDAFGDLSKADAERCYELVDKCDYEEGYKRVNIGEMWNNAPSKANGQANIRTIVTYCEGGTGSAGVKEKLRFVGKALWEDFQKPEKEREYDTAAILVTLALHGNVCNVQKEVGVQTVYSLIANNLKDVMAVESLPNRVLALLQTLRDNAAEKVYIAQTGGSLNTHPLTGFRNGYVKSFGLLMVPDEHTTTVVPNAETFGRLRAEYTVPILVARISAALHDSPPQIKRDSLVNWLKENAPEQDEWYEFLEELHDMDSGRFKDESIMLVLVMIGVLRPPKGHTWAIGGAEYRVKRGKLVRADTCSASINSSEEKEGVAAPASDASSSSSSSSSAPAADAEKPRRKRIRRKGKRAADADALARPKVVVGGLFDDVDDDAMDLFAPAPAPAAPAMQVGDDEVFNLFELAKPRPADLEDVFNGEHLFGASKDDAAEGMKQEQEPGPAQLAHSWVEQEEINIAVLFESAEQPQNLRSSLDVVDVVDVVDALALKASRDEEDAIEALDVPNVVALYPGLMNREVESV